MEDWDEVVFRLMASSRCRAWNMAAMLMVVLKTHLYRHLWHCEWEQFVQVLLMTKMPPHMWQWTAWALMGMGLETVLVMASI